MGKKHQTVDSLSENGGVRWVLGSLFLFDTKILGKVSLNVWDNGNKCLGNIQNSSHWLACFPMKKRCINY